MFVSEGASNGAKGEEGLLSEELRERQDDQLFVGPAHPGDDLSVQEALIEEDEGLHAPLVFGEAEGGLDRQPAEAQGAFLVANRQVGRDPVSDFRRTGEPLQDRSEVDDHVGRPAGTLTALCEVLDEVRNRLSCELQPLRTIREEEGAEEVHSVEPNDDQVELDRREVLDGDGVSRTTSEEGVFAFAVVFRLHDLQKSFLQTRELFHRPIRLPVEGQEPKRVLFVLVIGVLHEPRASVVRDEPSEVGVDRTIARGDPRVALPVLRIADEFEGEESVASQFHHPHVLVEHQGRDPGRGEPVRSALEPTVLALFEFTESEGQGEALAAFIRRRVCRRIVPVHVLPSSRFEADVLSMVQVTTCVGA